MTDQEQAWIQKYRASLQLPAVAEPRWRRTVSALISKCQILAARMAAKSRSLRSIG